MFEMKKWPYNTIQYRRIQNNKKIFVEQKNNSMHK